MMSLLKRRRPAAVILFSCVVIGIAGAAVLDDLALVGQLHDPQGEHVLQGDLNGSPNHEAFEEAFEVGDELFEVTFNALDGIGANVGQGQRFSRVPRADLDGPGEWAQHFPARATGPNAESCNSCHNQPHDDGAGNAAANVFRDPEHSGRLDRFIHRNTPHVQALGALQRLAEEMTDALHAQRDDLADEVCRTGQPATRRLRVQGVDFGMLGARPAGGDPGPGPGPGGGGGGGGRRKAAPCPVDFDTRDIRGVDDDLVVRPFQWKGTVASVRAFNVDAAHNELGMQPVELVGAGQDGDFDGVTDELEVGDITALTIYLAAQARPTSLLELADLGLTELAPDARAAIERGQALFNDSSCAGCHVPALRIQNPTFSEPSSNPHFRDAVFPSGDDPLGWGLDPANPISFDLTADQPDNRITQADGSVYHLGALRGDGAGGALVEAYGDMKRHRLGQELAESIDETGHGPGTWLTENLWGVGSTAPYLHDGRATTLTEAILAHGGEATPSREEFLALSPQQQADMIAFLNNLVLYKAP